MRPQLSEFSYGYALTEELVTTAGGGITAAPQFPSLYQEGQPGYGYDVLLPFPVAPVFLQFKLVDFMRRRSAAEWNLFGTAYFRMHLRPARFSRQHALLLALENTGQRVFYAAPHFYETEILNQCYLNREVVAWSVFVPPSAIGALPDEGDHHVAFLQDVGYVCSTKPQKLKYAIGGSHHVALFAHIAERAQQKPDRPMFVSFLDEMVEALGRRAPRDPLLDRVTSPEFRENAPVAQVAHTAAYVARLRFGAEIVLLGRKVPPPTTNTSGQA